MNTHTDDMKVYGRALAASAERRPEFIGFALARWRQDNPERKIEEHLECDLDAVWKLAVTPRPAAGGFEALRHLAETCGANPEALIELVSDANE